MLRKLMKYEFMATGRIFLPLLGALIVLSLVNGLLGNLNLSIPHGITLFLTIILMVSIMVIVYIITIQRFWQNILSDEGYLMNTLPASCDKLILSKLFVATIWGIVSSFVVFGAILILAVAGFDLLGVRGGFDTVMSQLPFASHELAILVIQFIVMVILSAFANILMMYACMSLSMLFNKYRPIAAFGAFVVIMTVLQIAAAILMLITVNNAQFHEFMMSASTFSGVQVAVWTTTVLVTLMCVVFYIITRFMLKRKLNLQ